MMVGSFFWEKMTFVNPTMLWALFFGLTPIIIYYLMRYRSLREPWGANYVLERALDRLRNRWYLEQLILIMLRIVACLLLVFAFTRPLTESGSEITGTGTHHVIVADGSYSMRAGEEGETRWDRSKEAMKELVGSWGRGEKWSLLLLGDGEDKGGRWVVEEADIRSGKDAEERIEGLEPGQYSSSIYQGLQKVQSAYGEEKMDVYLFADDQATAWEGYEDMGDLLEGGIVKDGSGRALPVFWVNPPLEDYENVAVTDVWPASDMAIVDDPTRVFIKVKNFGRKSRQDIDVSLLADGDRVGGKDVSLLPGQSRWVHVDYTPESAGSRRLTAQVGEDVLEFDNNMSAGLESRKKVSVLVLADDEEPDKLESAWGFLGVMSRALGNSGSENGSEEFAEFELSSDDDIENVLPEYDVVLLDGAKTITRELVQQLRQWVNYGGLILAADERIKQDVWNENLGKAGLLPATLSGVRSESRGGETYRTLARTRLDDSPFRVFESKDMGDVSNAKIFVWRTVNDLAEDAHSWMLYDDESTFVAERPINPGSGRSIMLTSGLSGRNSNMMVRKFYVPLVHQLIKVAAAGTIYPRTVDLNEDIFMRVDDPEEVKTVAYKEQGEQSVPLSMEEQEGRTIVREGGVSQSGHVSILVIGQEGTSRVWFGVQGPRDDSNLTPVTDDFRADLTGSDEVTELEGWTDLENELEDAGRGVEWHHWVLVALLAVFVAEMFFERRFV